MEAPCPETPTVVSVILVTYKRVQHLRQTLSSLLETATYPRSQLEIILCDDGSPAEIQYLMRELPCDRFLLSARNAGMGANANKGLREATGDYILHLQDDWKCIGPPDLIEASLEVFRERPDVGFIRLRNAFDGPYEEYITASRRIVHIYYNRPERRGTAGEYAYTDNPHIKRKSVHDYCGLYKESRSMVETEMDFCFRFENQDVYRCAFIVGYETFMHTGESESFNPLARRARIAGILNRFAPGRWALKINRGLKQVVTRVAKRGHRF